MHLGTLYILNVTLHATLEKVAIATTQIQSRTFCYSRHSDVTAMFDSYTEVASYLSSLKQRRNQAIAKCIMFYKIILITWSVLTFIITYSQ